MRCSCASLIGQSVLMRCSWQRLNVAGQTGSIKLCCGCPNSASAGWTRPLCMVQGENLGHQLADGHSSLYPELQSRITPHAEPPRPTDLYTLAGIRWISTARVLRAVWGVSTAAALLGLTLHAVRGDPKTPSPVDRRASIVASARLYRKLSCDRSGTATRARAHRRIERTKQPGCLLRAHKLGQVADGLRCCHGSRRPSAPC